MRSNSGFGMEDYFRMLQSDWRAPFYYFAERHWFDLYHNTDTHKRLLVEDYDRDIIDCDHSFNHSCSWTSVIKASLKFATEYLGDDVSKYAFFDIGCGKGKVLLVTAMTSAGRRFRDVYGVEINEDLVAIARQNFQAVGLSQCNIITESARTLNLGTWAANAVIYLYNPFDAFLLSEFLGKQTLTRAIIIYNNPQFTNVITDYGFKLIGGFDHVMTNGQVKIFEKNEL